MIKVKNINKIDGYTLELLFNNGEIKQLDFKRIIDNNEKDIYIKKLVNLEKFCQVRVGDLGEIYWENLATIKELDGSIVPCNYDCSPEFIYANAK